MYISPEAIDQARKTDLLTYLQEHEPNKLVRVSGSTYCTREHDSLKISNGKWYWFSRGIGGVSALDYLIKVEGYRFLDAVEAVTGHVAVMSVPKQNPVPKERKLLIPELSTDPTIARQYLMSRGISRDVIDFCIQHSLLFETEKQHSALFVGYDKRGIVRHGAVRSTNSPFKGDITGSDKHYSFCIPGEEERGHVHLFEAAIDALSYATIQMRKGREWRRDDLLSLAGVFQNKRQNVIPIALRQYLDDHPHVKTLHLHLDNDEVGRGAAVGIMNGLSKDYVILDEPPLPGCKDINDELIKRVREKECDAR